MADELAFEATLDRPKIPTTNVETELKCHVKLWPSMDLREAESKPMETSICLAFDCSASMLGEKLETAIESAKMIVDTIHETHKVSLIAFQASIHNLVDNARATESQKDAIKAQIEEVRGISGGSTNMTDGIKEGTKAILRGESDARVMIILSDGSADFPDAAERAAHAATAAGIQLFAVGIGADFEADHLLKLVTPSNGTVFGQREVEKIKATFSHLICRIESFVATTAYLDVTFDDSVAAGLAYKTSPEQAFIGNMQPDEQHTVRFNVGNIERDKEYSFLFLAIVPKRAAGPLELCRARITYDVPALDLEGVTDELGISVEYTDDRKQAEHIEGEVMEVFRRASITQLAERFVDAYKAGNKEQTAKFLGILVRRYDEIGDAAMKNHYENLLRDLQAKGEITQEMLNASVVASTVVAGGGELPHLVDDDF